MEDFTIRRRRNIKTGTGGDYKTAFTKTELLERGWTSSLIDRYLVAPDAVLHQGFVKYQYDTRRVYKTEGSPAFQMDLLALEDVRLMGPRWLQRLTAYIPKMMIAALTHREAEALEKGLKNKAQGYRELLENLPPQKPTNPPPPPPIQTSNEIRAD